MKVWFADVSKRDARALVRWWNAHTIDDFFIEAEPNKPGRYRVVKQERTTNVAHETGSD